jgi:hypothetical protein
VYQQYFNERFQTYGRRIRLFAHDNTNTEQRQRDNGATFAETYKVFAATGTGDKYHDELIRRKVVDFGSFQNPHKFYADNAPYAYSFNMDGTRLMRLQAEFACKQLIGKKAQWAGSDDLRAKTRELGAMVYNREIREGWADAFFEGLKACGAEVKTPVIYTDNTGADQAFATAVSKWRADGVTSVVCICDPLGPITATNAATSQAYFPEWIMTGSIGIDTNGAARLFEKQQWSHAFGLAVTDMARPFPEYDWYRAYKEIDPDNEPDSNVGKALFRDLLQIVGAIQQAGPTLTPETFRQGLATRWITRPPDPVYEVAGGYASGDFTFADYVAPVWWDGTVPDPEDPTQLGAYRHVNGGRRYTLGELPTDPLPYFTNGISQPNGG